ncbi:MAG: DNA repair protein RecO [Candidatus Anoxychlamydiales bacterium]|nr:DNA repair protein RecO [Candidatus Anoxychlamydiales bacterium]
MLIKTKAITLKSTPFKDRSKILQVLTDDLGIVSIIVKSLSKKNLNMLSFCSPFTISEIILKKNRSDIYSLRDLSLVDANMHLRKNLKDLTAASFMIKAILDSHIYQKKDFNLFLLLKSYLKKISINPDAIHLSFLLKLLSNEGFLHLKTKCSNCEKDAISLLNGESLCFEHSNSYAIKFELEDFKKIFVLCFSKSFALLKDIEISKNLKEKVNALFQELI